jgi:hypothetical protein
MSLAVAPSGSFAVDLDQHVLGFFLDQRLRGQHMLDLRGADAVRQRAESAMRGGVAVAADNGGAGQGEALFRARRCARCPDACRFRKVLDTEVGRVLCQCLDLDAAFFVLDAERRSVVGTLWSTTARVFSGQCANLAAGAQAFEGLRAGDFVHEMAVDVEQAGAVLLLDDQMVVPDLVLVECARCGHAKCAAKLPKTRTIESALV